MFSRGLDFSRRRRGKVNMDRLRRVLTNVGIIVGAIVLGILLTIGFGKKTTMIGYSMTPSIEDGTQVLMDRVIYSFKKPKCGDIIAFRPDGDKQSHLYIKRVLGTPGDTVLIKDGKIYLNDAEYKGIDFDGEIEDAGLAGSKITVRDDEYFVLGDNLNDGEDSRFSTIGNVKKEDIVGKVWFKVSFFEDFGII